MLGAANSSDCPTGSIRVSSSTVCESAAAATGRSWGRSHYSEYAPKGCYWNMSGADVYFNSATTGAGEASSQPLCFIGAPLCFTATA